MKNKRYFESETAFHMLKIYKKCGLKMPTFFTSIS